MATSWVRLPWDEDARPVDVLEVHGSAPFQQLRCVVASDPDCPDLDRPLRVWLHVTEVAPELLEGAREASPA